jgi:regulator of sirC expression with transglutaminase-like and TPR domain
MHGRYVLPDWNSLAACGDDELPLLETALLIARDEYPHLDAGAYAETIQSYADALKPKLGGDIDLPATLTTINRYLFEELGFAGNNTQYDDPRNSYLNEVFDRKLGIPISLAVVQIELTRRLGLPLDGISFPGHFLVRMPVDDGILVMDPVQQGPSGQRRRTEGARLAAPGRQPARRRAADRDPRAGDAPRDPVAHAAQPQRPVPAQGRLGARGAHLRPAAEDLAGNAEPLRDRGLAYRELGYAKGAREDLARYLQKLPNAEDAEAVRDALIDLGGSRALLN